MKKRILKIFLEKLNENALTTCLLNVVCNLLKFAFGCPKFLEIIASEVVIYILFSSIVLILNQFCPIDSTLFMNYLNFKIKCEYLADTLINIFRRNLFINHLNFEKCEYLADTSINISSSIFSEIVSKLIFKS